MEWWKGWLPRSDAFPLRRVWVVVGKGSGREAQSVRKKGKARKGKGGEREGMERTGLLRKAKGR